MIKNKLQQKAELLEQLEERLPKEKDEKDARKKDAWDLAIGYNEALLEVREIIKQLSK